MANLALGLDTIPCLLSPWSEWSDCSVTCGKGMRTRQRMLKSLAELGDCNEELEQVEKCMLPECRKSASPPLCPRLTSLCRITLSNRLLGREKEHGFGPLLAEHLSVNLLIRNEDPTTIYKAHKPQATVGSKWET